MTLAAADLAEFVDEDMPGYALATISGGDVPGLFGAAPLEVFGVVSSAKYAFRAVTTSVSTVTVGTAITINSTAYTVAEVLTDGNGMTMLLLKA